MKARVKATGEVIDVSPVIDPMGNSFYTENGISHYNPRWYAYYSSDLDFDVEMTDEFKTKSQQTLMHLKGAQQHIQAAQRSIGNACHCGIVNGNERKLLSRVKVNLVDPIEQIEIVVNAIKIGLK